MLSISCDAFDVSSVLLSALLQARFDCCVSLPGRERQSARPQNGLLCEQVLLR